MKKKILAAIIVLLIFLPLLRVVYQNWSQYTTPFNLPLTETIYKSSVYVKEKGGAWIADEILFAYAGWNYINGGSPILINPENPPLGKYIIGLSVRLFNNEKIVALVFSFLSLFSLFLLSHLFFKNKWPALLPVALFSWERLFREQLIFMPLMEVFALTFLNFSLYFFIKAENDYRYFWASSFFLGALWATRPWMATVPLLAAYLVFLILQKDRSQMISWLVSLPVAFLVLLASYTRLLAEGWGLYKILSVQKWILWYHQSRLIEFGSVWPLIYLNRWYVWWGNQPYLPMVQWSPFWPVFTTLALLFSGLVFLKIAGRAKARLKNFKFERKIAVLCLWVVFYLAFLSIGNISSRYLFYLLPYVYLLGTYLILVKYLQWASKT